MNIIIIEEIEKGYRPSNLVTKISESVTLTIEAFVYYEKSRVVGVCEDNKTASALIKMRKEYLTKKYGPDCLKESNKNTYFSFKVTLSTTKKEEVNEDE